MDRDGGSAVVESIFGTFLLLVLALGAIQTALFLYARNVVMAAVHDGARAAIELDAPPTSATGTADRVIARSAGGLLADRSIEVVQESSRDRYSVTVIATGNLSAPGPILIQLPITARATATREIVDVPRP